MVSIQLTDYCNCDCLYCYNETGRKQSIINEADFYKLIDEFEQSNVFRISLEGGEPFLHPKILDLLLYIDNTNINFTIISNGTLINKHLAQFLASLKNCEIIISLDSDNEETNNSTRSNYNKTIRGINNLINANITFGINTVINKFNIDSCYKIIEIFYPAVKKFSYLRLIPRNQNDIIIHDLLKYNESQIKVLESKLDDLNRMHDDLRIESPFNLSGNKNLSCSEIIDIPGCLAGSTFITIKANLDVIPCSYCQNTIIGNLKKEDFKMVWSSMELKQIRRSDIIPCQV